MNQCKGLLIFCQFVREAFNNKLIKVVPLYYLLPSIPFVFIRFNKAEYTRQQITFTLAHNWQNTQKVQIVVNPLHSAIMSRGPIRML